MGTKRLHHDSLAYKDLSADWQRVIDRGESGTWIFPPLAGINYLVQKFVAARIEHRAPTPSDGLWVASCMLQAAAYTKESIYEELYAALVSQIPNALPASVQDLQALVSYLAARNESVAIFVQGLDNAIRAGNAEAFALLNRLALGSENISVILLLGIDITDPQFSATFSRFAALIQNITIVPRKTTDEGKEFLRSLQDAWDVHLTPDQMRWVQDNLDLSLRLVKEVFRQVQKNPNLTYDELFTLPSLEYKVQALLDNYLEDQREVILRVVFGEPITPELGHALRYLRRIRMVHEVDEHLALVVPYIDYYIRHKEQKDAAGQTMHLSPKEEAAYNLLQASRNTVVSRDQLADVIWGEEAAERYSDWAIDQLMHRLKSKVGAMDRASSLQTVRGRGFILAEPAAH